MKSILTLLAVAVVAFSLTGCQTAPKKECCSPHGTCDVKK